MIQHGVKVPNQLKIKKFSHTFNNNWINFINKKQLSNLTVCKDNYVKFKFITRDVIFCVIILILSLIIL